MFQTFQLLLVTIIFVLFLKVEAFSLQNSKLLSTLKNDHKSCTRNVNVVMFSQKDSANVSGNLKVTTSHKEHSILSHSRILATKKEDNFQSEDLKLTNNNLRIPYLILWTSFLTYAFTLAPPADSIATIEIINNILSTPFDGSVNPIFVCIFNLLGVLPIIYASLLLPAAKKQSIPAAPFVFGAFALGFFATGPYLGNY